MIRQWVLRTAVWFVVALFLLGSIVALAASNSVVASRITEETSAIDANALKPSECAALNLTSIYVCPIGSNRCNTGNTSELVLGTPNSETIQGGNGADCILAGGADDSINGQNGTDVCIGGPGTDSFKNGCETQIQ